MLPSLTLVLQDELQAVIDEIKVMDMENDIVKRLSEKFMHYIQETWVSGIYSPDMWSCFGRRSDHTNNAQEAYNSVFNRLVKVAHPNVLVLVEHFVMELN